MLHEPMPVADLLARGGEATEVSGKSYAYLATDGVWAAFKVEAGVARQFGGSVTREGVERIVADDASGLSAERGKRFFDWMDSTVAGVGEGVRSLVAAAGMGPHHTGGGCMSWRKDLGDGTHVLVCTEDNGIDGDPDAADWIVGRYCDAGGFFFVESPMNLRDALAAAAVIPSPVDANGETDDVAHPTLDAAVSAGAARDARIATAKERMGYEHILKADSVDLGGLVVEVALLGPGGNYGDVWSVATHEDCDPDHDTRGSSGIESYDSLDEATVAWRDTLGSYRHGLAAPGMR